MRTDKYLVDAGTRGYGRTAHVIVYPGDGLGAGQPAADTGLVGDHRDTHTGAGEEQQTFAGALLPAPLLRVTDPPALGSFAIEHAVAVQNDVTNSHWSVALVLVEPSHVAGNALGDRLEGTIVADGTQTLEVRLGPGLIAVA